MRSPSGHAPLAPRSSHSRLARSRGVAAALLGLGLTAVACGGPGNLPTGSPSKLSEKTFAGQNKCNPKSADRPFIIEWDATDQSSFQSYAASDIVFVRYEGCELKPIDGCRDDASKGWMGSYKPVEFTSGGVETIDIHDEGELYAKLPLGAATLSGRVQSGEKFHMEYYVSGTRTATRDKVWKGALAKNPKCAAATHFVYAYNLGAFGIAATSSLKGEVNGSYLGFGAGGSKATATAAEKKGGDLSACKGESAKEVEACKVPIRLTLREISPGDDPEAAASRAPESDATLNLAGKLKATSEAEKRALTLAQSASVKRQSGDGKGCLADLDQHDALDPRPGGLSSNPASYENALLRGECLMLSGQCSAGKGLYSRAFAARQSGNVGPEHIEKVAEANAAQLCRGGGLSEREQFLGAISTMNMGGLGVQKKSVAECQAAFDTFMKLHGTVKRKDATDTMVPEHPLTGVSMTAPNCLARAGDCTAAFKAFKAINDAKGPNDGWKARDDKGLRTSFDGLVPLCVGK